MFITELSRNVCVSRSLLPAFDTLIQQGSDQNRSCRTVFEGTRLEVSVVPRDKYTQHNIHHPSPEPTSDNTNSAGFIVSPQTPPADPSSASQSTGSTSLMDVKTKLLTLRVTYKRAPSYSSPSNVSSRRVCCAVVVAWVFHISRVFQEPN